MTPDPVITDAEVRAFGHAERAGGTRNALSAFLKARVPDARSGSMEDEYVERAAEGFNACREAVLRGKT